MSSDQQLNVHISIVNDLCHDNDSQRDNPFDCSVLNYTNIENTLDDIIAANIVLENETNCGIKHSQYTQDKENGDVTENLEIKEYNERSLKGENILQSGQQTVALDVVNDFEGIIPSGDKFNFENNDAIRHNGRESENILNSNSDSLNDNCSSNLNDEAISSLNIVDPQIQNGISPPTILSFGQSNEQSSDISNQKQWSDIENNEIQKENNKETNFNEEETTNEPELFNKEPPNVTSEANNEAAELATVNHNIGEGIENDDEASNDENVSNEQDSNEDSSEFNDNVEFDDTNEVENDEYILDTFVRKPRKERRRIVSINDDSDSEIQEERERLLQSPMVEVDKLSEIEDADKDIDLEQLILNEKPGPKSKKMSTQKLKELQARALLRNAVVIPSSGNKKKKSRIIDSDDEEGDNVLLPYVVDVDDIGLPDMIEDNDETDVLEANSILLNDIEKPDIDPIENAKQDESIEQNSICAISSFENHSQETEKRTPENIPTTSQNSGNVNCPIENYENPQKSQKQSIGIVHEPVNYELSEATSKNEMAMCDSGNSTDSIDQQHSKYSNVKNVPPFPSSSSSEDEDEFIPNDVYFGTPDLNKKGARGKGRPRGRPAQTTSRGIATTQQNITQHIERGRGTARRGRPPRRDRFIDNQQTSSTSGSPSTSSSNESEDEYQKSKARRKQHTITIVKTPSQLYHNVSLPIQKQQSPQQREKRRKQDRFYDKSQDIPNSIYFGDVDVPLHVLHAYGDSDSDNDKRINPNLKTGIKLGEAKGNTIRFSSQVSRGRGRPIPSSYGQMHTDARRQRTTSPYSNSQKSRGRPKINSVSPSNDQSIQMMKKFLRAAGLKKVKLNRLWEGCKSNSERAAKMLELLREKGLEGEPTISKCRQLKVDYLTKKEIEDLDPNLIIQTEGRTRRSVTRAATKRQYTYDEDEILETRTKLRNVIDSDSEFD